MATMPPTISFPKGALDLDVGTSPSARCKRSLLVPDPRTAKHLVQPPKPVLRPWLGQEVVEAREHKADQVVMKA